MSPSAAFYICQYQGHLQPKQRAQGAHHHRRDQPRVPRLRAARPEGEEAEERVRAELERLRLRHVAPVREHTHGAPRQHAHGRLPHYQKIEHGAAREENVKPVRRAAEPVPPPVRDRRRARQEQENTQPRLIGTRGGQQHPRGRLEVHAPGGGGGGRHALSGLIYYPNLVKFQGFTCNVNKD